MTELEEGQVVAYKARDGSLHENKMDWAIRNSESEVAEDTLHLARKMRLPSFGNQGQPVEEISSMIENALRSDPNLFITLGSKAQHLNALKELRKERTKS